MAKAVKISVLCDDQARMGFMDKMFLAQHGLSLFLEVDETAKILFDTGPSDVFLHNASLLGIRIEMTHMIVLSHGHWDHGNGLKHLAAKGIKVPVLIHPGAFINRCRATGEYNGLPFDREEAAARFDLIVRSEPYRISEDVWFLGEIPRVNDFEAKSTRFYYWKDGTKIADMILDDSALVVTTPVGIIILTGCSHSGICNIIEYAKQVTGYKSVYMIAGGFHLLDDPFQLQKTLEYLQKNKVQHLYPMHCTDLEALSALHCAFGIRRLCAGDVLEINMNRDY